MQLMYSSVKKILTNQPSPQKEAPRGSGVFLYVYLTGYLHLTMTELLG